MKRLHVKTTLHANNVHVTATDNATGAHLLHTTVMLPQDTTLGDTRIIQSEVLSLMCNLVANGIVELASRDDIGCEVEAMLDERDSYVSDDGYESRDIDALTSDRRAWYHDMVTTLDMLNDDGDFE